MIKNVPIRLLFGVVADFGILCNASVARFYKCITNRLI